MRYDSRFDDLPNDLKVSLIHQYGILVDSLIAEYHVVDLYSIGTAFIEVWRCIQNGETQVVVWSDYDRLEKFLPVNLDMMIGL
jgi:hypothetical protein